jgi:hypothetical protein
MNINIDNVSRLLPGTRIECMKTQNNVLVPEKIRFYGFQTNVFYVKSASNLEFHARTPEGPVVKISSTYFRQPQLTWIENDLIVAATEIEAVHTCPEIEVDHAPIPVIQSTVSQPAVNVRSSFLEEQLPLF